MALSIEPQTGTGRGWLPALRELRDNPLQHYFELAARRAFQRQSLLLRLLFYLGAPLFGVAYAWYSSQVRSAYSLQSTELDLLMLVSSAISALLWVRQLQALWLLAYRSLALLGRDTRQASTMCLDDCLAISQLSNAELAVGALAGPVVRLAGLFAAGAVAGSVHATLQSWAAQLQMSQTLSSMQGSAAGAAANPSGNFSLPEPPLFFGLWLCLPIVTAASLAVPCLALNWLSAGRGLKAALLAPISALVYIIYSIIWPWTFMALTTQFMWPGLPEAAPPVWFAGLATFCALLAASFLLIPWDWLAARRPLARAVSAVIGPSPLFMLTLMGGLLTYTLLSLSALFLSSGATPGWSFLSPFDNPDAPLYRSLLFGALQPLGWASPQGLLSVSMFVGMGLSGVAARDFLLIAVAMTPGTALILLRLARNAQRAIEERRRGRLE